METVLQVPSGDPIETARYLLYRIQTLWPESLAYTLGQEPEGFSIRGVGQPSAYYVNKSQADLDALVWEGAPDDLQPPTIEPNGIRVSCEPNKVILRPRGPEGELVANQLVQDPIWGPDWLAAQRVKVCS